MKKACKGCGLEYTDDEGWVSCPECGEMYCLHCTDKMRKEHQEIEKLRDGDPITRLQILCPSCSIDMINQVR
ncbi:MAG: hypothetical protein HY787_03730 [Deltaproteobacteria bacterium]|nr:hypothetical protein [Deltaproteobacteria bacterium]